MGEHAKPHRTRFPIIGLAGAVAAVGLFGLTESAQAVSCQQSGNTFTCTFSNPGAMEPFTVPANATSATADLRGGGGGNGAGFVDDDATPIPTAGAGGEGAPGGRSVAPLTPGVPLSIFIGGPGGDGTGCATGDDGGAGGVSGGPAYKTGGDGGAGESDDSSEPTACAGGGGGGGSFIMLSGQSPDQIQFEVDEENPEVPAQSTGVTPVLVAGGGGGGGGGVDQEEPDTSVGGAGGGTTSGPAVDGPGGGGQAAESLDAQGLSGENGYDNGSFSGDAGGGGGGGFTGSEGGDAGYSVNDVPGSGGGGGGHTGSDYQIDLAAVPASIERGAAVNASAPALGSRPIQHGIGGPGEAGRLTITYTVPGGSPGVSTTDTEQCHPSDDTCVVRPPAGEASEFKIIAFGGKDGATLFGILNGGRPPTCRSAGGTLALDWVQFGFLNARDGRTWSKIIRETGLNPTLKEQAKRILAQTQICFAAPYKFVVKRGEKLTRAGDNWEGLLAHCKSRIVAEAKAEQPDLARPCIIKRSLVKKGDGWTVRVNYYVPFGELDPQGRSLRKKKKKRR